MQQHALPLTFFGINKVRASECSLYLLLVVDVDAGLKGECFGDDVGLRTMIVLEAEVVRAAEWQIALKVAAHVLILLKTDGYNQLCQLFALSQLEVVFQWLFGHQTLCFWIVQGLIHTNFSNCNFLQIFFTHSFNVFFVKHKF